MRPAIYLAWVAFVASLIVLAVQNTWGLTLFFGEGALLSIGTLLVYSSILEALQNTAKYAQAKSATVTMTATNGSLGFEVSDDGKGFDSTVTPAGAGLNGMADRLDTVGGAVTITSTPGQGTLIAGSVPVQQLAGIQ